MNIVYPGPPYKSIQPFEWREVPRFVVLTGLNGSGKTQLLELIAGSLGLIVFPEGVDRRRADSGIAFPVKAGITPSGLQGVFRRSQWPPADEAANLRTLIERADFVWNARGPQETPTVARLWSMVQAKVGKPQEQIARAEFNAALPPNFPLLAGDSFQNNISMLFVSYMHSIAVAGDEAVPGPMPWDVLDNLLSRARLPYTVDRPEKPEVRLLEENQPEYAFALVRRHTGRRVLPGDLSAGERVILQIALWFFSFSQTDPPALGVAGRLLLLDEPDAHLHPALTKAFLDVVLAELVEKHGVRVIMSTHSASTVALAPENSLFEMTPHGPRPAGSKLKVLGQLTAGYLTIGSESKCVFVEAANDKIFFTAVVTMLTGPRSFTPMLDPAKSILFISSSDADPEPGRLRSSGGRDKVKLLVRAIETTKVAGIIDRDDSNAANERVHVLARYSLENYLLDPLFIYALVLEQKKAPPVPGVTLSMRDGASLLDRSADELQAIADVMLASMAAMLPGASDAKGRVAVRYANGREIQIDRWFIESKVEQLLQPLKKAYGLPFGIPYLTTQYERLEIVPQDLVDILHAIQQA